MTRPESSSLGWLLSPKELWTAIGIIVLATVLTFGTILGHQFLLWDDTLLITQNAIIRGFSWFTVSKAFTSFDPELYIPVTFLTYQLNYALAGLTPWIYFATNLSLHALNALLVGWLLLLLTGKKSGALFGALLFALLPIQTEAVAWASARKDLLSACFFFSSLILWLRYRDTGRRVHYGWSLGFFLLALLSKVIAVTLPVVLILLDIMERRPLDRRAVTEKLPFFGLSVIFGIVAIFGKSDSGAVISPETLLLLPAKSTLFSLQHIVWPSGLTALYAYGKPVTLGNPGILWPWIILAVLLAAVLWLGRKRRTVFFAVAFFLLTLAPTFENVMKGGFVYIASDRYVYIPLFGILFLVAIGWDRLWERAHGGYRTAMQSCATLLLLLYAVLSWGQTETWATSQALFTQALKVDPQSVPAALNLGVDERMRGDYTGAEKMIRQSLAEKESSKGYIALGTLEMMKKNFPEAAADFEKAASVDPKDPEAPYGLASVYEKDGQLAEAEAAYRQALTLTPFDSQIMNDLAGVLEEEGKIDAARDEYKLVVKKQPTFEIADYNLGLILEQQGDIAGAIDAFRLAKRYGGNNYFTLSHLGPLELKGGRTADGAADVLAALALQGGDAGFLQNVLSALQTVLTNNPEDSNAKLLLQELMQRGLIKQH